MIKQYTIGRGEDNQIHIQDNTQRVSRNHATLKIRNNGKLFITDHSSNGTFVNGIKICQNADYPIKRGDTISFANAAELNWDLIASKPKNIIFYIIGSASVIVIVVVYLFFFTSKPTPIPTPDNTKKEVKIEPAVDIKNDIPKKGKADSLVSAKKAQDKKDIKKEKQTKNKAKNNQKEKTVTKKAVIDSTKKVKSTRIFFN